MIYRIHLWTAMVLVGHQIHVRRPLGHKSSHQRGQTKEKWPGMAHNQCKLPPTCAPRVLPPSIPARESTITSAALLLSNI